MRTPEEIGKFQAQIEAAGLSLTSTRSNAAMLQFKNGDEAASCLEKAVKREEVARQSWIDNALDPWCKRHGISREQALSIAFDDGSFDPQNPSKDRVTMKSLFEWGGQQNDFAGYLMRNSKLAYDTKQIAAELTATALGKSYYGNALRLAKDIHCLTPQDRSVLDRYATGANAGTDHVHLQEIAIKIAAINSPYAEEDHPVREVLYTTEQRDQIAANFYTYLLRDVGVEKIEIIEQRNRDEKDPAICHSHDFVDANMTMLEAFVDVMGFEPDLRSATQSELWNDAWNFAKSAMKETSNVVLEASSPLDMPSVETVYRARVDFRYPAGSPDESAEQYYGRKRQLDTAIDDVVQGVPGLKAAVHIGIAKVAPYIDLEHSDKNNVYRAACKAVAAVREHGGAVVFQEPAVSDAPAP